LAAHLYSTLAPLGLQPNDVTSVVSGPHVKGSAHTAGRALDVGTVGGADIGYNPTTLAFVRRAIEKGGLQRIGSELSIINDPQIRALAAQHGVDLFRDDVSTGATGPHLHLQVAPSSAQPLTNPNTREADFRNRSAGRAPGPPLASTALDPYAGAAHALNAPGTNQPAFGGGHPQQMAGINPIAAVQTIFAQHGALNNVVKAAQFNLYRAAHAPIEALDAILGAPQRYASGTINAAGGLGGAAKAGLFGPNPIAGITNPAARAAIGHGMQVATHPRDESLQQKNTAQTVHGVGLDASTTDVDRGVEQYHGPFSSAVKALGHGTNHVARDFAAQVLTDPLSYIPLVGEVVNAGRAVTVLDRAGQAAKAVGGTDRAFVPATRSAQGIGNRVLSMGREVFGRRPELNEHLDETGRVARMGIEKKWQSKIADTLGRSDEALLRSNKPALHNVAQAADGTWQLPDAIRQRYLQEPYVYGNEEMRKAALEEGYHPTPEEAATAPEGILNYNVRSDYQTLIQPKAAKSLDETPAFQQFESYYKDGKAAFERMRREENGGLGADQYDIVANRLRLGRLFIQRRKVDQETEQFLAQHGGFKDGIPTPVSNLSHSATRYRIPVLDSVRRAGKQAVIGNPFPHGLRNVGELAYLSGGPEAFGRGLAYATKGLDEAQVERLTNMGARTEYTRNISGPLANVPGLKETTAGGQVILNRLELGYRQSLLDHYDHVLGPSRSVADEYRKADLINRDLGDYHNVSRFVAALDAIGGPFVSFRLGIVPAAVGRSIRARPNLPENVARTENDINTDPHALGNQPQKFNLGGPVDDFARLVTDPEKFMLSPSTIGPWALLDRLHKTDQGDQPESAGSFAAEEVRQYVPLSGVGESMFGLPYGGPSVTHPSQAPSALAQALMQAFGPYLSRKPSKKAEQRYKRTLEKRQ